MSRHGYLPTDNVGRLFCWPCWDRLEKENARLAGHTDEEECDHCGKTIKPYKTRGFPTPENYFQQNADFS